MQSTARESLVGYPLQRRVGSFCYWHSAAPLAMGAGSSKRVHPEATFHAADTDKDGKLTPQELGAMLRAKGFLE